MRYKFIILLIFVFLTELSAEMPQKLKFEKVFPNLSFERPIGFLINPVKKELSYVLGHKGKVWEVLFNSDAKSKKVILDISSKVGKMNEGGLLDMVFHPDFTKNNKVIVCYTNEKPKEDRVSSFTMTDKGIDPDSEKIHLKVDRPFGERNICQTAFGPDGYFYVGLGDGGKANDPNRNGQNLHTLYGSVLRIDIKNQDEGYVIPKDNPFLSTKGARGEIWAYGLRVPWSISFDQKTGILYCADVGQDKIEEVNVIEKGKNYGWRVKEGSLKFKDSEKKDTVYVMPVAEYNREVGLSIIGGHVYRGKIKKLRGVYIYCDYITNNFWGLRYNGKKVTESKELGNYFYSVSSFAQDNNGEIYVCSFAEKNIFKISGAE